MDLGRDDAITLLAYSMAASDGTTTDDEEDAIQQRMKERGIVLPTPRSLELRRWATEAHDDASALLRRIAEALPDEADRSEAMRLALDVVWADASIEPSEMTQIMEVADELGLGRTAASRLIEARTA